MQNKANVQAFYDLMFNEYKPSGRGDRAVRRRRLPAAQPPTSVTGSRRSSPTSTGWRVGSAAQAGRVQAHDRGGRPRGAALLPGTGPAIAITPASTSSASTTAARSWSTGTCSRSIPTHRVRERQRDVLMVARRTGPRLPVRVDRRAGRDVAAARVDERSRAQPPSPSAGTVWMSGVEGG